jgi:cytochrome P450
LKPLKFVGRPLKGLEELSTCQGDIVIVRVGHKKLCLVTHPAAIKQVLATKADHFEKGHLQQRYLGTIVGDGLLLSEGDYWADQRSHIQPAFSPERFEAYTESVTRITESFTSDWEDGDVIRLDAALQELTLQILAETLFGLDLDGEIEIFARTARTITSRFDFTSLTTFVPEWIPIPKHRRYRGDLAEFDAVLYDLIETRRQRLEADGEDTSDDILGMLLPVCDDDTLRDEIATILLGGHDTSALAITYTLYLIATNPDIERRVRSELDSVMDGDIDLQSINALEYTTQVVQESMRLFPPSYSVFREPTEPVEIGGGTITPGTTLVLPQWVVHRDERWWDSPEAVRPERFDGSTDRPEYAYYPFSGGPRGCIGKEFGMIEIQATLAKLLQQYEFSTVDDDPMTFVPSLTLRPEGGLRMRIRER